MLKEFFQSNRKAILIGVVGIVLGAVGGLFYWKYMGDYASAESLIISSPYRTSMYGAVIGGLFLSFWEPRRSSQQ